MSGFDYGNARLRAMKARLISMKDLEALTESETLSGLIVALTRTAYRKAIEAALSQASGKECIDLALHKDLVETMDKIIDFYQDESREIVAIRLQRYDVHNLKAILRGLSRNAAPDQILLTLMPVGKLRINFLKELASVPEPRGAIDLLASTNSPFAQPFLRLRSEHPGADTSLMEIWLDQWNYEATQKFLESISQSDGILANAIKIEADLVNLLTILRFAQMPAERKFLRGWLGTENLNQLFIGPGHIPLDVFVNAGVEDSLDATVNWFTRTIYEPVIQDGMKVYAQSGRLSDLEKRLQRFLKKWLVSQIAKDPLGIGVLLGFLALKENEVSNIRRIAYGIGMDFNPAVIQADLEFI